MIARPTILAEFKLMQSMIRESEWRIKGQSILNHSLTKTILILLTIWSLFADELKLLLTTKESDNAFSISIIIVQIIFLIDLIASCIYFEGYRLGFYFWIDLLSIITMLLDIHWFYDIILKNISTNSTFPKNEILHSNNAKVGSRAIRILRIIRLLRIIRISKFYKFSQSANFRNMRNPCEIFDKKENKNEKLRMSKTFKDFTIRKISVLVIAMIIGIVIFNPNFYYISINSMEFGLKTFKIYDRMDDPAFKVAFDSYILSHKEIISPIKYLSVINLTYGNLKETTFLRLEEIIEVVEDCSNLLSSTINSGKTHECYAIFDSRIESRLSALLNIIKTVVIIIIIFIGSSCFTGETESLVVKPFNSMINKIRKYLKNPAKAKKEEKLEESNKLNNELTKNSKKCFGKKECEDEEKKKVETVILEKTIEKICSILALSYGETGSNIIEKNMRDNKGIINPLASATYMIGVFCLCKLLFQNEIFQLFGPNCSILINEIYKKIGEIIEEEGIYMYRNTGDGLLLIWKIDERFMKKNDEGFIFIENCPEVNQLVDKAVISIINMLLKLGKSSNLRNDDITADGCDYCIIDNISFSLNSGWALEGITGSNFKKEISYQSPTIRLAKKLEEFNKYHYQRNLILLSDVYEYLSNDSKNYFRIMDSIKFEDNVSKSKFHFNKFNLGILTIDMDLFELPIEKEKSTRSKRSISKVRKGKSLLSVHPSEATNAWINFITTNREFLKIRKRYSNEFIQTSNQGFEYFIQGNWDLAKKLFEKSNFLIGGQDLIIEEILRYMTKFNFITPQNWEGSRNLKE